jgi:hypothetical protein
MPDVRTAASGVLGTAFTGDAARRFSLCIGTEARGHHGARVRLECKDFLAAVDQKSTHGHRQWFGDSTNLSRGRPMVSGDEVDGKELMRKWPSGDTSYCKPMIRAPVMRV